jgi:hypothetical protein
MLILETQSDEIGTEALLRKVRTVLDSAAVPESRG